jgi:predicted MFS family arabinose efflux permease
VIGGQVVSTLGLVQTPWIGAVIVLGALLLIRLSGYLDKKGKPALA